MNKDYNRLTKRDVVGTCINIYEFANEVKKWQERHGLYDYMGADATQILLERLADLEDKIENGILIEVLCKIGDIVYQTDGERIDELMILDVLIRKKTPYYETDTIDFDGTAIGKTVFLTKAEAQARLRELQGERE